MDVHSGGSQGTQRMPAATRWLTHLLGEGGSITPTSTTDRVFEDAKLIILRSPCCTIPLCKGSLVFVYCEGGLPEKDVLTVNRSHGQNGH